MKPFPKKRIVNVSYVVRVFTSKLVVFRISAVSLHFDQYSDKTGCKDTDDYLVKHRSKRETFMQAV